MTGAELNTLINFKTKTNDTTFPVASKLPLVQIFKNEIASKIVEKNVGYFLIPTVFDLVANQREYPWPTDQLNRMKKLELKFDSSSSRKPSTFLKDYSGSETESEITTYFSNNEKCFAHTIRRRAFFVLSGTIISVTGGGRLLYYSLPADIDLTSSSDMSLDPTTTTFGFPLPFHELLARRISIEWKGSQPKPIPLNRHELNYENDLKAALDALSVVDEQGEIIANPLPCQETGHNGFDY